MDPRPIAVVEVEPFASKAKEVWDDDEKTEFITYLAYNPEAGIVIPGSGGLRKLRWGRKGVGKRGGVRVIYYFHDPFTGSGGLRKLRWGRKGVGKRGGVRVIYYFHDDSITFTTTPGRYSCSVFFRRAERQI